MIRKTGMPLKMFADAVGWKNYQVLRWWTQTDILLTFKELEQLSQFIGVSVDSLVAGSYPFSLIRARIHGGPAALPDLYAESASSHVRSSAHIIEYLALYYGRRFADQILLKLNVHPLIFENLENEINLLFFIDLLNELQRAGLNKDEIDSLACYIFLRLQSTPLGQEFSQANTYQECYAILAKNTAAIESNFEYFFQIDSHQIQILAKPTEAWKFIEGRNPKESERLFSYRKRLMGWFPILSNLPPLAMETPKCIFTGDEFTLYQGKFPEQPSKSLKTASNLYLLSSF